MSCKNCPKQLIHKTRAEFDLEPGVVTINGKKIEGVKSVTINFEKPPVVVNHEPQSVTKFEKEFTSTRLESRRRKKLVPR